MRRAIAAAAVAGVVALLALLADDDGRRPKAPTSVLGTKLTRCEPRTHRLSAENAPMTVTIAGGRITSVLAPPLKISPGAPASARLVSFVVGRPRMSGGALAVDVTLRNLTDCAARLRLAHAISARGDGPSVVSPIRFGLADETIVAPGRQVAGAVSIPLRGDGRYEIAATTYAEIGLVR
jgi:hypothetical protein